MRESSLVAFSRRIVQVAVSALHHEVGYAGGNEGVYIVWIVYLDFRNDGRRYTEFL
jgi:hypothetical protein